MRFVGAGPQSSRIGAETAGLIGRRNTRLHEFPPEPTPSEPARGPEPLAQLPACAN